MKQEKTKNIIIFVLLGVIILLIGIICGVMLNKKVTNETPIKEEEKEEVKEPTTDEVLSLLVGEWGTCAGYYNCYGLIVSQDGNNYTYTPYVMWSEFGGNGNIQKVESLGDNKYKLTVYFPAYEDELNSSPERTGEYTVDITNAKNNELYFGETKYQKITGDREAFFQSIMS